MKTLFLALFALFIPISFFVLYQNFFSTELVSDDIPTELPNNQLSLPPTQGRDIVVPDVTKLPNVTKDQYNDGLYYIGQDLSVENRQDSFAITYDDSTGYFNVMLLKQPFSDARRDAESRLLSTLKIDEDDLCRLNYSVTVPGYVNAEASGVDYRFSFCEGSLAI